MKCPVCAVNLNMSEKQGIEIDYCPQCRGIWLDRGELEKIIERSNQQVQGPSPRQDPSFGSRGYHDDDYKYKRKKSFLSDLFD